MNYNDKSVTSIVEYAKNIRGKNFGEIDKFQRLKNNSGKGNLGQVVEESYFGYKVNSKAEADFSNVGVELKVTPYKINKNKTISAKERLVLNIINYLEEHNNTFETSSFWTKNNKLLLIFYEWKKDLDKKDYVITDIMLYEFPEEDLVVIRKDWDTIITKIRNGKAHEISEADTNYLGACSKGANKESLREQPFSDELAMQRAYSLKSSYMTYVLRKHFGEKAEKSYSILKDTIKTIEEVLDEKFAPFYTKSIEEICEILDVDLYSKNNKLPKNYVQILCSRILGINDSEIKDLDNSIEEFSKANIKLKTIRIEKNGRIKEHMSFRTFKYTEIVNETWEESELRNLFLEQRYLFVVFREDEYGILRLEKIQLWNMPLEILDSKLKDTWEETVRIINNGVKIEVRKNKTYDNLPGSKFNSICHTRPHARDKNDTYVLPDGRSHVKKSFWLDREYILSIIK
ncbi:Sau3AI family type II restriction endonuclease [Clostridioides difficile]|uniref:Sau3AI family type II restriction endonuclease n=1 Tax=Clostridioides difficile TaxID=1496 RepID=UPI001C15E339|nr:Sau3AI family type II restriction endonuclease [Clostridioides difficile]HBF6215051.1 restriction endonuclease [Clostridioides difficile]HBF6481522.1 restriction endonuclease [Clostridioides difficile]HBF6526409.1 restriction endonuclease [Clostridioides difficile]HBG7859478.1 restriction endonuclease [Clostridioides difficile]